MEKVVEQATMAKVSRGGDEDFLRPEKQKKKYTSKISMQLTPKRRLTARQQVILAMDCDDIDDSDGGDRGEDNKDDSQPMEIDDDDDDDEELPFTDARDSPTDEKEVSGVASKINTTITLSKHSNETDEDETDIDEDVNAKGNDKFTTPPQKPKRKKTTSKDNHSTEVYITFLLIVYFK